MNILILSVSKNDLPSRLDAVQALVDAKNAANETVSKAEKTVRQTDVDDARSKVERLPKGKDKDDLNRRLDTVQAAIDKQAILDALVKAATEAT